ncbi:ParB/RepB/Spo0J family partition protein [Ketogulonicigenium vulgare]|uniref:ParB-like protein nuclease domain family protein n=1 Tax=Ketogulonicigenium vulgare (strain WSH-001) TaxID=759362 RepID=F9Y686_KETVW|nr:ParB/RepB/Spo0J family partition protein [Ketogulonicigenium vulgare]ADO43823.1 chromosome partitioning protein parB [Ketogulonicigenium vulgare Y25]AEM42083.1 ParB-like protein nuclease domain family protein [Ketogulonicigenium vulgare WSH-001]ALJ82178.1 chromosome partitioning protein ParB [Ketogulonicigenium vulgare]ANW34798.1 chromosome partitioning protein ParB [Ketogulonicigenium vulgare]AOZ55857.1 chromosome partitioning protein parB [Ketogulonicigenium vulgare]
MAEKPVRTRALGRGLSALMADVAADTNEEKPRRPDMRVPIEHVHPNPDQPRRHFDEEALDELTASIREKGIIQPLIVRADPGRPGQYQIVAGERRWRAAQRARLHEVPVVHRSYSDTEVLEIAIIENIQRADLNAIDEAAGYRQLMERFGHTQEQMATALGKSRSHIANLIRLLQLPDTVQEKVVLGALSAGHARTLIGHPKAEELAQHIVTRNLSVREAERLTRDPASPGSKPRPRATKSEQAKDADTVALEKELSATLKMDISIDHLPGQESGSITLRYKDLAQLDDVLRLLSGG